MPDLGTATNEEHDKVKDKKDCYIAFYDGTAWKRAGSFRPYADALAEIGEFAASDPDRGLTYGILHDSKGFGVIASKDGLHWRDGRNFRAIGKQIPKAGGGELKPARFERPSVFSEDGMPRVLSGAAQFDGGKDACIILIPLSSE